LAENAVASGCRLLYPFLGWQVLPALEDGRDRDEARGWIEVMVAPRLVSSAPSRLLRRRIHSPAFARWVDARASWARRSSATCHAALSESASLGPIERARFEDVAPVRSRMACDGPQRSEFFDTALFRPTSTR